MSSKLRVAILGCGQIADAHAQEIAKISTARVVAACDSLPDLARQLAERFSIPETYDDLATMLARVQPDVVHITTPPHSHAPLAQKVLAAGCHAYVEKPFTVDVAEADAVFAAARAANRLVCAGHDQLFDPCWAELRARHHRGDLGQVVHIDSVFGYNLTGPFGRVLSGDPGHWVHRLPGGLFQNNISHAVYKITDFLTDDRPEVWATWFGPTRSSLPDLAAGSTSPADAPPTELRVLLRGRAVTATVLFSSAARPVQRVARVYGTRACVEVDWDGRLLRWGRAAGAPGAFGKLEMPLRHLAEAGKSLGRNLWRFLRGDLQYFAGMNRLFRAFYRAIQTGGESPTPPTDVRRVTAIMDDIFAACQKPTCGASDRVRIGGGA